MSADALNFERSLSRRGYALRNTRDGAHELYHALTCGVPLRGGPSEREWLNRKIEERFPGMERWWNEVEARVVERFVCERLGCERQLLTVEGALRLSIEEAKSYDVPHSSFEETHAYALRFGESKRARASVDLLLAYAAKEASR